eukprot:NODE_17_length_48642_cov_1.199349.p16 type:complete len:342 gc:universal NODE_17_length_48642_cov_1.199349:36481-35456(-)
MTQTQKVIKRKYVRKRIPTSTSDEGSDATIVRSQSDLTEKSVAIVEKPVFLPHTGLVHTQIRLAPLDKFANSDYSGFVNLLGSLSLAMVFRLVMENMSKYGILVHLPTLSLYDAQFLVCCIAFHIFHYFSGFIIEAGRKNQFFFRNSMRWHSVNALSLLVDQTYIVGRYCKNPAIGIGALLFATILVLKLFSFAFVTLNEHRQVTLKDYSIFLLIPTLCFQYEYPKAPSRSFLKAFRYLTEFCLSMSFILILAQQYAQPTLENSIQMIKSREMTSFQLLERILKLSLSVSLIWLAMFYGFFHAYLYFWAEITQFGDRLFYREWWNSSELATYWRLWFLLLI